MMKIYQDRNIRYNRKKNFIKKGFEFSEICGLDVIILTFEKKTNKIKEYFTKTDFKMENII